MDVVALIPAAGSATRLGDRKGSKEVASLGGKTPLELLLGSLGEARVDRAWVILRRGKWDIPEHLESLSMARPRLSYLVVDKTPGVPHTLDAAYPFVAEKRVALGFPDILIRPRDAFLPLLRAQEESGADVALALFPTVHSHRADMVKTDPRGRVRRLVIKVPGSGLEYAWSLAVWTPRFTELLHRTVREAGAGPPKPELYVGDVIQKGIDEGLHVQALEFPHGDSFDIGTPEALAEAEQRFSEDGGQRLLGTPQQ